MKNLDFHIASLSQNVTLNFNPSDPRNIRERFKNSFADDTLKNSRIQAKNKYST